MKMHLLRCAQKYKNTQAEARLGEDLNIRQCAWTKCEHSPLSIVSAASHMNKHLYVKVDQCKWASCSYLAGDMIELQLHLRDAHYVYTTATLPTRAKFCFECRVWILSDLEWALHNSYHASHPDIIYGPVIAEGILAAPRRCPYCMRNGIYLQMENNLGQYLEHIETHIQESSSVDGIFQCPHLQCEVCDLTKEELRNHLTRVHEIPLCIVANR